MRGTCGVINNLAALNDQYQGQSSQNFPQYPQFNPQYPQFNPLFPQFNPQYPQFNPQYPQFNQQFPQFNQQAPQINTGNPQISAENPAISLQIPAETQFGSVFPTSEPKNQPQPEEIETTPAPAVALPEDDNLRRVIESVFENERNAALA